MPYIVKCLEAQDAVVRKAAVTALGSVGNASPSAIKSLTTIVKSDSDELLRLEAVRSLMKLKAAARESLPVLRALRQDPETDEELRLALTKAINQISGSR
jgi:HEAT repeat protein